MNSELAKIREMRYNDKSFNHEPTRINYDRMTEMMYELNSNFGAIYLMRSQNVLNATDFAKKITTNLYIIINMFNEMGIYPDYFYDAVAKNRFDYKKDHDNSSSLRVNNSILKKTRLPYELSEVIKKGITNGYYRLKAYPKRNMNEELRDMIAFFEEFKIPYNDSSKEQCDKVFDEIKYNHLTMIGRLSNSDDIYDDVECLAQLLFEYMSIYVSLGIHPEKSLDNFIASVENARKK